MTTFLTAEWRQLAMLNWRVDAGILAPLIPRGTELDEHGGSTWVSVVGFLFLRTRVLGLPVPGHTDFEEVNLRLYVRRTVGGETRRGVVFVREMVPRIMIAQTAYWWFHEPYLTRSMRHRVGTGAGSAKVAYEWKGDQRWEGLSLEHEGDWRDIPRGSETEFLAIRDWGYTRRRDGSTSEYRVEHPRWRVASGRHALLDADVRPLYGERFVPVLRNPPHSAFLADGSAVSVSFPSIVG